MNLFNIIHAQDGRKLTSNEMLVRDWYCIIKNIFQVLSYILLACIEVIIVLIILTLLFKFVIWLIPIKIL